MLYEVNLSQTNSNLHDKIRMTSGVDFLYVEVIKNIEEDRLFQEYKEYTVDDT